MPRRSKRDPDLGAIVGERFHIQTLLADGGMSRVYIATDGPGGPKVAIKIQGVDQRKPEILIARAKREAETLTKLNHKNIVTLLDSGPHRGGWFLAFNYIEGTSLTKHLRAHSSTPAEKLGLMQQLGEALKYVHDCGLVHRDLKSANVLVTETRPPHVYLIDFGIVHVDGLTTLSGKQGLLGSVHTVSPEQVRGETIDYRADIYSFGILLYRIFAGRYPFHSKVSAEVISQHACAPPPRLVPSDDVPALLPDIVDRCLQKLPAERYESMAPLLNDLMECDITLIPEDAVARSKSEIGNNLLIAALVGVLILIGLVGYQILTSHP